MMPRAALFFAAGLGTRMAPLTETRPKPLIPVGETTLLDHALALGDAAGISRPVVNMHYLADQIETHLTGRAVALSDERDALLETGGGLKKALPLLGENPVFTMNTDAAWAGSNPFEQLTAAWDEDMEALLLLVPPANALGHRGKGDFVSDKAGRLTPGPGAIYSGAQIIRTDRLFAIDAAAFSMWDLWRPMIAAGTLFGTMHDGRWCDVGRPESLPLAEQLIRGG